MKFGQNLLHKSLIKIYYSLIQSSKWNKQTMCTTRLKGEQPDLKPSRRQNKTNRHEYYKLSGTSLLTNYSKPLYRTTHLTEQNETTRKPTHMSVQLSVCLPNQPVKRKHRNTEQICFRPGSCCAFCQHWFRNFCP